ncbi:MAG TPA: flavin prenyltransferase UbiX [Candidatus Thiothrix moscowensis]|uniref:flavin prenyltransferase UbiX n=1 Tax=unclassified Thiothrix TaxID=2636184 RepID=UPI0025F95831|nr:MULTISPECIES: flavin prenyltransferase UbiX [unclassified Thiothrix]HRJ51695.1 flavin prenyltransferase UbiX [Candidatus Thiothrix moscowensis]HRJ92010.1 flavin prenyltransferase UbiX [Candidatus Thiothrix moscowensis]
MPKNITLIMTGASGAQYGLRLLECLLQAGCRVYLLLSRPAQVVINMETEHRLPGRASEIQVYFNQLYGAQPGQLQVFEREQWAAPIASGSAVADATVVCPCTTGTLSAIASGSSRNLIERAADVALKERKKLILVVRETPFSEIHLENMLKLARMGVIIMPANPGFYHRPASVQELVDFMVARVLDHLDIPQALMPRWGQAAPQEQQNF